MPNPLPALPQLLWDIFCRVIDNHGDAGVCWRLCADLASRGQRVRLWIDDPAPLSWMAPDGAPGVEVRQWIGEFHLGDAVPGDVWIEAFGCELPEAFVAARQGAPVWLNLEYLSAEPYVERMHRLPSPVMRGPGAGLTKWFFYPGFTERTGGLLREPDLMARREAFDANRWLQSQRLPTDGRHIALFCYEPASLPAVMAQADAHWLVTPGRPARAVERVAEKAGTVHALPWLTQRDFDHLLWASDFNAVRGEDSLVRAIWAGQPFVWHIYPQDDNAHHAKLDAFLDWLGAPPSLRTFHHHWNGIDTRGAGWPGWDVVDGWRDCVLAARARLLAQPDLTAQLQRFVQEKR
jgi:uncharacterized repeat protein (TIGR03837 family)